MSKKATDLKPATKRPAELSDDEMDKASGGGFCYDPINNCFAAPDPTPGGGGNRRKKGPA